MAALCSFGSHVRLTTYTDTHVVKDCLGFVVFHIASVACHQVACKHSRENVLCMYV